MKRGNEARLADYGVVSLMAWRVGRTWTVAIGGTWTGYGPTVESAISAALDKLESAKGRQEVRA